jgi:ketosteroid isomerase-like protein
MIAGLYSSNTVAIINQNTTEVFVHGEMAYEFGTQELRIQPRDAELVTTKFCYVSVFKMQADGSWKWHHWFGQPER